MGNFKHEAIDLGYNDLDTKTGPGGRVYTDPSGNTYPSITTVLSILSREAIQAWRARVGAEEANKISRIASSRGTEVHNLLERYVDNDPDFSKGVMPNILQSFYDVKDVLDNNAELYNEIDSKIKLALKKVQDMNHSSPSNNHDNENDETKSEVL